MDLDGTTEHDVSSGDGAGTAGQRPDARATPLSHSVQGQSLTPEQQALLARRLIQKRKAARVEESSQPATILRVPRDQPLPLSFSQQRVWLLDQFEPGTPAYNLVSTVRLTGELDISALQRTLDEIVRRHEVLRTVFVAQDDRPVQVIRPPANGACQLIDLESTPAAEHAAHISQIVSAETRHSFDLSRGPLFRTLLLRLDSRTHILCLNVHHIVFDGWSRSVLLQELVALYEAFHAGLPSPLPELAVQYADFAHWQQQLLQGAYLERQVVYWQRQLAATQALNLPTDRPRPPIRTTAGARLRYAIDRDVTLGLKQLASSLGVSLYIVLLAGLKTLLHRYSNDTQIGVGTFIANRRRQEIEPLIGFFVNTLVLHTDLSGQPTFRELVQRVRQVAIGAYEHQDLPFEHLLERLRPARDLSHTPFFQVMLVLQNTPKSTVELAGLHIEPIDPLDELHAQCDFSVWLTEEQDELNGLIEYNTDLFDKTTMLRWSEHLTNLLTNVVTDPDQRIATIPFLPPSERERLLSDWAAAPAAPAPAPGIPGLVAQWAVQQPDAVALRWRDQQMTYAQLDRRANQLAHALQARGVGPESRVGLCVERSPDLIVSLLAVLKAGAAYVPLDPAYPAERLAFMLRDSQPRLVVTQQALRASLPPSDVEMICLDEEHAQLDAYPADAPVCRSTAESLAYVIYTSGSTGRSKGVLVEQRSLLNYTAWASRAFALSATDRVLQFASISFDAAAEEIYPTLSTGGTLVLREDRLLDSFDHLLSACDRFGITVLDLPTAYWHQLVAALVEQQMRLPESLRLVVIGGERALAGIVAQWHTEVDPGGQTRLINTYGPTETTIAATYCELTPERIAASAEVPIGRPIANLQVYVVDRHLQPVPIGVPGELAIGGAGLARGYHHGAALTAARFVPHPWSTTPGARLYITGDLVRYVSDGHLEFLGRNDHQVKIRGYRIELGEIEALLTQHPAVEQAVVIVGQDGLSHSQLIAYVVPRPDLKISELRSYLKAHVPEHMLPALFVELAALPLSTNGKVDRKALPSPDRSARSLEHGYVAPRDAIELQLADIWEDLLRARPVGVLDNFFDLGGHSLLAVHLMARIHRRFHKQLPLTTLFQGATIAHLANVLRSNPDSSRWSPLVPMQTKGQQPPLFCVPGAGGNVIGFYSLTRHLGADRPIYGLQSQGVDGEAAPHTSIEEMAACSVAAIRQVQPEGPYLLCGHSFGCWVAFEIAQQLQRQGQTVELLALFNSPTPRVISDDPAYRHESRGRGRDDLTMLLVVGRSLERAFGHDLALSPDHLLGLSVEERIVYLTEQLKRVNILPAEADTRHVRGFVNVFKTNYGISYQPTDCRPTRIVLFRAADRFDDDTDVPPIIRDDPAWGWNEFASQPVDVHVVPGEHQTMLNEPHVQTLAERLGAYLR